MLNRYMVLPLLGIAFILSSVLKAMDWTAFAVQVSYYGIVREPWIVRAISLALIGLEFGLGCALLLRLALRSLTLPAVFALLLGFSLLLVWAWVFRDLKDCGCFGKYLPMSPGESLWKNAVMLAMVGFAWWGLRGRSKRERGEPSSLQNPLKPRRAGRLTLDAGRLWRLGLLAAGTLGVMAFAVVNPFAPSASGEASALASSDNFAPVNEGSSDEPGDGGGKFAKYSFEWQGERLDLGMEVCFVAMLSDSCAHCAELVASLNRMSKDPSLPRIIGLVLGEEETLKNFRATFHPEFATRLIPVLEFFDLIGDAPPRFYLVDNGREAKYWDEEIPQAAAILEAAKSLGTPSNGG
ncbi:MAG: hypothetical protein NTW86_17580 [Candidatus Sumerlaeota bacterium]|nr:hypothetical protein [Candidatus Sumerlaeota bacterium]